MLSEHTHILISSFFPNGFTQWGTEAIKAIYNPESIHYIIAYMQWLRAYPEDTFFPGSLTTCTLSMKEMKLNRAKQNHWGEFPQLFKMKGIKTWKIIQC